MPSDLEILWNEYLVYVQPASEHGADWLQRVMPRKFLWEMRALPHEAVQDFALAARDQGLSIGGIAMPMREML